MGKQQNTRVEGTALVIDRLGRAGNVLRSERHEFATEAEANGRLRIIDEGMSWDGTPFLNCGDIKGPQGGIDCAMLQTRSYVDTGRLPPFEPRPYPPAWMLHRSGERYLEWIEEKLGGVRTEDPKPGDCVVWFFGRCYSHGGILINSEEVVHAYALAHVCMISRMDEDFLKYIAHRSLKIERPKLFFQVGGAWK